MEKIKISIKNVYGKELIYAHTFTKELMDLTGTKTLNKTHVQALIDMGYEFEIVPQEVKL